MHVRDLISAMAIELRDYTTLAMQLDDTILALLISSWFREINRVIGKDQGRQNKSLDAVTLAFWHHK